MPHSETVLAAALASVLLALPARADAPQPPPGLIQAAANLPSGNGEAALEIRSSAADDILTAPTRDVRQRFVVLNHTSDLLRLRLGDLSGSKTVATTWAAPGRTIDTTRTVDVAPHDRLVLTASAADVGTGRYDLAIVAERAGKAAVVYQYVVDRRGPVSSADVFTPRKDPAQAYTALLPFESVIAPIEFDVKSSAPDAVQIGEPFVQAGVRTAGGTAIAGAAESQGGDITCGAPSAATAASGRGSVALPPNTLCRGLVRAKVRWPGVYHIRTVGNGIEGGQAVADLVLNVKANPLWAVAAMLVGLATGSWITRWRTKGRAKALAQLALANENERVGRLDAAARRFGQPTLLANVSAELDALLDDVASDRTTDVTPQLDKIGARLAFIERWCELAHQIAALPDSAKAQLQIEAGGVADDLSDPLANDPDLDAQLQTLATDIRSGSTAVAQAAVTMTAPPRSSPRIFQGGARLPTRRIADVIRASDALVDIASGVVVGLTLFSTSWLITPAWGSWSDFAALLTASLGLQTGATAMARPQPGA